MITDQSEISQPVMGSEKYTGLKSNVGRNVLHSESKLYSRFVFELSANRRINYFVLNDVKCFVLLYQCVIYLRYLLKVTEAEREEGYQQ